MPQTFVELHVLFSSNTKFFSFCEKKNWLAIYQTSFFFFLGTQLVYILKRLSSRLKGVGHFQA